MEVEIYLEFSKNLDWFYDVAHDNHIAVHQVAWKSKYNSYAVYDYEPFCSDGFMVICTVSGEIANLEFISFLLRERENTLRRLHRSYNDNADFSKVPELELV
jgi:hypothetical protein